MSPAPTETEPSPASAGSGAPGPLVKKRTLVLRDKVTPSSVCTPKLPEDCIALGTQTQYGGPGFIKDPAMAARYYRIACDANEMAGCTILADLYFNGRGVAEDEAAGMRLLRHACARDDCMSLGFKLVESDQQADRTEALTIFASICDGKSGYEDDVGSACFMRADRAPTRVDGAPWHDKACQAGHERGCSALARLYFTDEFPHTTAAAGTRALEQMCDREYAPACEYAAQRHFEGTGAKASRAEADRWLQKACDVGDEHACDALARRRR